MKAIDCYGFERISCDYFNRELKAADVHESGTYTYIRFTTSSPCPIHRIEKNGEVTSIRWAYGDWNAREELDYVNTLNEPMEI